MAGIGFELKKIYGRKTLVSYVWGTVYATMTTIGPALMSAVLMLILKLLLDRSQISAYDSRFFISSATYAFLIAALTSVVFGTPVSRYISDCIYLEKEGCICSSALGVLTLSSLTSGVIMFLLCFKVYRFDPATPLPFLISYFTLGVLVTNTFTLMTYASSLDYYRELTLSFFLGGVLAVFVYFFCNGRFGLSKITVAVIALAACYFLTTLMLIFLCVRAFGVSHGKVFEFLTYFKKYPQLAFTATAYMAGIYCPTVIYWFFSGMSEQVNIFRTCLSYDMNLFLAVAMNTSSLVIFVVKVETAFYEKYTLYVSALNHGTYDIIEKTRGNMTRTLRRQLFSVYEIQLIITVATVCLICVAFPFMSADIKMLNMFIVLSFGLYAVFCMYFTIVVFYYFADYTGACIGTLVFFIVTALTAAMTVWFDALYSLPLFLGGTSGWLVSFLLLRRRMEKLNPFLLCKG